MNYLCRFSLMVLILPALVNVALSGREDEMKIKARAIAHEASSENRPDALKRLADLPPSVAIPCLLTYIDPRYNETPGQRVALSVIRNMLGVSDYFLKQIKEHNTGIDAAYKVHQDFEMLELIANEESAKAAALFLFDDSRAIQIEADNSASDIRWQAATALTRMKLPNAPVIKDDILLNEEDLHTWRHWAIEQKYVTEEEKAVFEKNVPDPDDAKRVWPPDSKANLSAVILKKESPSPVLANRGRSAVTEFKCYLRAGVVTVLTCAGVWLLLWLRNKKGNRGQGK